MLACHLKGIKDGVHYEYRETMPYKREPEFIEVSPKDHGMIQKPVCFLNNFYFFLETLFAQSYVGISALFETTFTKSSLFFITSSNSWTKTCFFRHKNCYTYYLI